jgi:hypothetical protein
MERRVISTQMQEEDVKIETSLRPQALVIETIYDYAGSFNNGYALVEKDGTDMIINKKGEVINTK